MMQGSDKGLRIKYMLTSLKSASSYVSRHTPRGKKKIEGNEPKSNNMLHRVKELDTKTDNTSSIPVTHKAEEKNWLQWVVMQADLHMHDTHGGNTQ